MLEVGAPSGWGPVGMDGPKLARAVAGLAQVAAGAASDLTVLRERKVDLLAASGPGAAGGLWIGLGCCRGLGGGWGDATVVWRLQRERRVWG